jgi:hypothetical protein
VDNEQSYRWLKFRNIKVETESTNWQHRTKQSAQIIFKIKFLSKKLTANVGYVNNMKKLLTT